MRFSLQSLLTFCLLFTLSIPLFAQGFVHRYETPFPYREGANDILQMSDGGFLIAGVAIRPVSGYDAMLIRTDAAGDTLWKAYPGSTFLSIVINSIEMSADSNYFISGWTQGSGISNQNFYWAKVDQMGNLIWENNWGDSGYNYSYHSTATYDNQLVVCGNAGGVRLLKSDSLGNVVWNKSYFNGSTAGCYWVEETSDQGYLVTGQLGQSAFALKTNQQGDSLWSWTAPASSKGRVGKELSNGDFLIVSSYSQRWDRLDANGVSLGSSNLGAYLIPRNFVEAQDGRIIVSGMASGSGVRPFAINIFDSSLNFIEQKKYNGRSSVINQGFDNIGIIETADHGFAYAHTFDPVGSTNFNMDAILIVTDSLGFTYDNYIEGNVFADADNNCLLDSTDFALGQVLVSLDQGNDWQMTAADGSYKFTADTGQHSVRVYNNNPFLSGSCVPGDSLLVTLSGQGAVEDSVDFPLEISTYCPLMTVNLGTGILRPGIVQNVSVNYCNQGFADAFPVEIEIVLDPYLALVSSSHSYTSLGNNVYSFALDTVLAQECTGLLLTVLPDTFATLGAAICIEAHITPDSSCFAVDPSWDGSSLSIEESCVGDSLACFTVRNQGASNMAGLSDWRLYENAVLVQSGTLQLNAGDSTTFCFAAAGNTLRMEVDQRPGHPGSSAPNATVEECDTTAQGLVVVGPYMQLPQDNGDHFVDILCRPLVNSYDPNEKRVYPTGVGSEHFVRPGQNLLYEIHFQNTGTAPAINVVLQDSLLEYLDLSSLQLVASSHPVSDFQVLPGRILQWRFLGINLPDSTNNEPESHGWVSFRMDHVAGIPLETRVDNRAAIFFDFNEPVITDWSFVTVHDTTIGTFSDPESPGQKLTLLAYPNPGSGQFNFKMDSEAPHGAYHLRILDLQGRVLSEQDWNGLGEKSFDLSGQANGIYLFELSQKGQRLGTGKLVKR